MSKETKHQTILDFIQEITDLNTKIQNKQQSSNDINELNERFLLVGLPDEDVNDLYISCGFSDFQDFHTQSKRPKTSHVGNVSCTVSKINGMTNAVVSFLRQEINKDLREEVDCD